MCSLLVGWRVNAIEMIGSSRKPMFTGLIEIITEILIRLRGPLGSLDHHKTDGTLVDTAIILQLIPVDTALVM